MNVNIIRIFAAVALGGLLTGCESPSGGTNHTGSGALVGGASGAAFGAMVGGANAGTGALIGGATGLIFGGLIGNSMDRQAQARWESLAPPLPPSAPAPTPVYSTAPSVQPTSIADIKGMAQAGTSDEVIIAQINNTHAVFNLDADALIDLHNAGVSPRVITYMINIPHSSIAQVSPAQQMEQVPPAPLQR